MKVAITGHISGIGLALFKVFPDRIGFSRSNGYNLQLSINRERMYNFIEDYDVFINNADLGWGQTILLYELWERWKDSKKIIVNIGSEASDQKKDFARPYNVQKFALQDACLQLQQANQPCKVVLVKPGYVDTPRVAHLNATKMDPNELALFIKGLVEMTHTSFWIPSITLHPR